VIGKGLAFIEVGFIRIFITTAASPNISQSSMDPEMNPRLQGVTLEIIPVTKNKKDSLEGFVLLCSC